MTIYYNLEDNPRTFDSVAPGEVFIFNYSAFIKVDDCEHAVNLENGTFQHFGNYCPVTAVEAELNIY